MTEHEEWTDREEWSGWTSCPHGLWTLPCSDKAKLMIAWLWSHDVKYLKTMWLRRAAKELGWSVSTTQRAFAELEAGGLITVERTEPGGRLRITRNRAAWVGLCDRVVGGVSVG